MSKPKILLVDDSKTTLMMERMILRKEQFDVVTAEDGEQGLEKAQAERPDLILLDVVMPKMDGFEVCRRLREIDGMSEVPVIMVTTRGESENVETGFDVGCNDYVTKPIDSLELVTKVRDWLAA